MCGKIRVVLEGGSIDSNGQGSLLTTEECLLGKVQERNPGMKRTDYEKIFGEYLGNQQRDLARFRHCWGRHPWTR